MKIAIAIVALLCLLALAVIFGLLRYARIDTAEQGVLLLNAVQSKECDAGGGCSAWSLRELQMLYMQAQTSCGKRI